MALNHGHFAPIQFRLDLLAGWRAGGGPELPARSRPPMKFTRREWLFILLWPMVAMAFL